ADSNEDEPWPDITLGYDWVHVRDEDEEGLPRCSCPTLFSVNSTYHPVVGSFMCFPRTAFLHSYSPLLLYRVVIVLYSTRPWTFLVELHTRLTWIEHWLQGDGA
ncbi:hypothetical protein V8E53_001710, partial [Lactarius tabidus]